MTSIWRPSTAATPSGHGARVQPVQLGVWVGWVASSSISCNSSHVVMNSVLHIGGVARYCRVRVTGVFFQNRRTCRPTSPGGPLRTPRLLLLASLRGTYSSGEQPPSGETTLLRLQPVSAGPRPQGTHRFSGQPWPCWAPDAVPPAAAPPDRQVAGRAEPRGRTAALCATPRGRAHARSAGQVRTSWSAPAHAEWRLRDVGQHVGD